MKVSEMFPDDYVTCNECGKQFGGRVNTRGEFISPWKQLAGHIMRSRDHYNKKWAKEFLLGERVGTGLFEDNSRGVFIE